MKVPGGADVNRSLTAVKKSLRACLRLVNQQAGKLLSKGDYTHAESLVEVAKSVNAFRTEVESLHERWKEINGAGGGDAKGEQTPLWEYYQPILQALGDLDGTAKIGELESMIEQLMNRRLLEGDLKMMAGGRARWQIMIRRARKHMVKEGLLEGDTGRVWKITSSGLKAAATGKSREE